MLAVAWSLRSELVTWGVSGLTGAGLSLSSIGGWCIPPLLVHLRTSFLPLLAAQCAYVTASCNERAIKIARREILVTRYVCLGMYVCVCLCACPRTSGSFYECAPVCAVSKWRPRIIRPTEHEGRAGNNQRKKGRKENGRRRPRRLATEVASKQVISPKKKRGFSFHRTCRLAEDASLQQRPERSIDRERTENLTECEERACQMQSLLSRTCMHIHIRCGKTAGWLFRAHDSSLCPATHFCLHHFSCSSHGMFLCSLC